MSGSSGRAFGRHPQLPLRRDADEDVVDRVEIVSLSTEGFRNLLNGKVELHPRLNLIVGDNGQGKTNLLEALALVSGRSSFRTREQYRDGKRVTRLSAARSLPAVFLTARDFSRRSGPPAERRAVAVGGAGPR